MSIRERLGDEKGSIAIAGLLLALALALLIGAGVDIARAFIIRRDLTAVADDAALAGSQRLDLEAWRQGTLALDPRQAEQAAEAELEADPQVTATAQAQSGEITVEVRRSFPTIVLRLVGITELTVTAAATARPERP